MPEFYRRDFRKVTRRFPLSSRRTPGPIRHGSRVGTRYWLPACCMNHAVWVPGLRFACPGRHRMRSRLPRNAHRQRFVAVHEVGRDALRLAHHLDARSKRFRISSQTMRSCISASRLPTQRWMPKPNDRCWRGRARSMMKLRRRSSITLLVAVARDVPHDHLVALPDRLAAELDVVQRGAAHVGERRLPADDLRHHVVDQRRVGAQLVDTRRVSGSAPAGRRSSSCGWCRCRRRSAASGCRELLRRPCPASPRCAPASRSGRRAAAALTRSFHRPVK